ncbi:MAG: hypothetical protein H7329_01470, partial [Opitutaceae bacterium]|nr:hypothetical protein [Cytophagales bacterium]
FNELNNKSYACLKFIYGTVDQLPESSDLDILISISDLPSAVAYIKNSRLVSKVKLVEKSFMSTAHIFFKDGSFLEIDLITAFKRKQHSMMNAADVLKGSRKQNGIFIPDIKHDFEYTFLFHQLNSSSIPKRYQDHFNSLPEKTQELITDYINLKYFLGELNFEDLFIKSIKIRKDLDLEISNLTGNLRLNWLKNKINYLKDTLIDILHNRGFTLTVSGVDGAGKSTVIEEIKLLLENKYRRKVVVLRHRPSILPILSAYVHGKEKAEKLTTERLPRTGANQSQLKSLFRFSYYLTDYLAGQFYVLFKYILRGVVVVYDRYYFDFISDAKRSNIIINPSIPRALYSLIQKPELNVFLYAPAAEILKRKQELNKTEIESLTLSYKNLFEELSLTGTRVKYLAIENLHLKETMQEIELKIINVA